HALEGAEAGGSTLDAVDDRVDALGGGVGDGVRVVVEDLVSMAPEHLGDLDDGTELHALGAADEVGEPPLRSFVGAHLPEQAKVLFPEPRLARLQVELPQLAEVLFSMFGDVLSAAQP